MSSACLANVEMPQYFASLPIEIYHPPRRTWWLTKRSHTGPQHFAYKLERRNSSKVRNFAEEVAVEIELLNSAVFPVGHQYRSLLVDLDGMWQAELPGTTAGPTPLLHPLAIESLFQDASVAVPISDEQVSVGCKGDVCGSSEPVAGFLLFAHGDGHELFAERRILDDDRRASIHCPHVTCWIDADTARYLAVSLARRAQDFPLAV